MKEIVVYWACLNKEWMRAKPPVDIYKNTIKKKSSLDIALKMCPGFKDYCSNNFGIQSIFDYEFGFNGTEFYSKDYSKEFFEKNVSIRSAEDKIFSFFYCHYYNITITIYYHYYYYLSSYLFIKI